MGLVLAAGWGISSSLRYTPAFVLSSCSSAEASEQQGQSSVLQYRMRARCGLVPATSYYCRGHIVLGKRL